MTCFQIRQLCLSLIFLGPYLSFLLRCIIMMKLYHRLGFHDGLKTEGVKWTPSSLTEWAQSHRTARKLWGEKYWRHQTSLSSGKLILCWGKQQQQQQKQGICQASCLSEDKLPLNQLSTPLLWQRLVQVCKESTSLGSVCLNADFLPCPRAIDAHRAFLFRRGKSLVVWPLC